MENLKRKEVIIGLLVVLAIAILVVGINFLKGVNLFKASNYYYATYTDVEGLALSAPVTLNGYKVGQVREISYDYANPGHINVEISVDRSLRMPLGSSAEISADLLGTASVVLHLGNAADGFYNIGDTIPGSVNAGLMASVSDNLIPAVNAIFPKVDTLLTNLNTLVCDPALRTSVARLDQITAELNGTLTSIHTLIAKLGPVAANVNSITANIDTVSTNLNTLSAQLSQLPVDSVAANIDQTLANLRTLTTSLNNPDSSVGKLLNDPELYNTLNSTVASLDSLFIDIKQNPKRYINVKVF